jgi:hypothetical protein
MLVAHGFCAHQSTAAMEWERWINCRDIASDIGLWQGPRIALLRSTASIFFQAIELCGCSFTKHYAINRLWIISLNILWAGVHSLKLLRAAICYKTELLLCYILIPWASSCEANLWLQRYGATAVGLYVTELQQFVVTLWSYSSWLLRYGVTATCGYATELQQLVVTLRSYSSLWLRSGATAVCGYNISELQHIIGDCWMQHIQGSEFHVKSQFYRRLALRIQIRWISSYEDFM